MDKKDLNSLFIMFRSWEFNVNILTKNSESEPKLSRKWDTRLRNLLISPIKKKMKPLKLKLNFKNKRVILKDLSSRKKEPEFRFLNWEKKLKRIEGKMELLEFKTMELTKNASRLRVISEDCWDKNLVSTKVCQELKMKTSNSMQEFLNSPLLFPSMKTPFQRRKKIAKS